MRTTLTVWTVELDRELLFVGDAGTTELSDASRRFGVTWTNFWQPVRQLRLDADVSFAHARFHELDHGEDRIPGALDRILSAGAAWEPVAETGPFVALRLRHFGEYPLHEDNSVRASATSLLYLNVRWAYRGLRFGASVLNLIDVEEADISYFYTSRLHDEPAGRTEDVHFHSVEPRQVRFTLSWGIERQVSRAGRRLRAAASLRRWNLEKARPSVTQRPRVHS